MQPGEMQRLARMGLRSVGGPKGEAMRAAGAFRRSTFCERARLCVWLAFVLACSVATAACDEVTGQAPVSCGHSSSAPASFPSTPTTQPANDSQEHAYSRAGERALPRKAIELPPGEIERLARLYRERHETDRLAELAEWVAARYLPEAGNAGVLWPGEWAAVLNAVAVDGTPSQRAAYGRVVARCVSEGRVLSRESSLGAVLKFAAAAERVSQGQVTSRQVLGQWLGMQEEWAQVPQEAREILLRLASGGSPEVRQGECAALEHAQATMSIVGLCAVGAVLQRCGCGPQSLSWCKAVLARACQREGDEIGAESLAALLKALRAHRLRLEPQEKLWLTNALAKAGVPFPGLDDEVYRCLAQSLGDGVSLPRLSSLLVDSEGQVRLQVSKVLAARFAELGAGRAFANKLDAQGAAAPEAGRGSWLLARAYAAGLAARDQDRWLVVTQQARLVLAEASSDAVRLQCIEELAAVARATCRFQEALQMIQSMRGQFAGAQAARLERLSEALTAEAAHAEAALQRRRALAVWSRSASAMVTDGSDVAHKR